MDELKAIIAHRVGKIIAKICKGQSLSGMMTPAKTTCGKRMIGIKLVALSLLEETAEIVKPTNRPANEESKNVINTSSAMGRKIPWCKGSIKAVTRRSMALCTMLRKPSTTSLE